MAEKRAIIALDQSTAATKATVFSHKAEILAGELIPHRQIYPKPGWVEHDPKEIAANIAAAISGAMAKAAESCGLSWDEVDSIAISNQRETALIWEKATGEPIYNALVWQDGRATEQCDRIASDHAYLREVTGLEPSPFFAAPKIAWLLENVPGAKARAEAGELVFGTMESFALHVLSGGKAPHRCDITNASRTLLLDLSAGKWDDRAFELFGIPRSMAPEIVMSDGPDAVTCGLPGVPDGIPIASFIGDSHGALFGQCCFEPGMAKATFGTGSSVMMNTGADRIRSAHGLVASAAYGTKDGIRYCLEGNINTTGGITKWFCEGIHILEEPSESGKIAATLSSNDGVYLVPALSGLAAPHWVSDARAAFVGMTSGTTKAHLIRAGEEAIAYQITDVVRAMSGDMGTPPSVLRADGGPTKDKFLMDFLGSVLGVPVETSGIAELSALGAAFVAGLRTGFWKDQEELKALRPAGKRYTGSLTPEESQKYYEGWLCALHTIIS